MDMTGDELKLVADHMGHSVAIHIDIYRLQSSVLERTKVARALVALEDGKLRNFHGKNLSTICFDGKLNFYARMTILVFRSRLVKLMQYPVVCLTIAKICYSISSDYSSQKLCYSVIWSHM